ncbi:MAG: hypothetical protein R3F35_23985 [Myxococcota bacterium]
MTPRRRNGWGGPRPGAGRPKGSGTGASPDARTHRVAVMLSQSELDRLAMLARVARKPLATYAYELILRGIRTSPRRSRPS